MLRFKTRRERLRLVTVDFAASTPLRTWKATGEGKQAWQAKEVLPSLERICHALDNTQSVICGLLIAPEFFTIISTFNRESFEPLRTRYWEAASAGLCFLVGWYAASPL